MAIFHLTVKAFSRSNGHSGTAAAAYRAGVKITDERTGLVHDYTKRAGVAASALLLPGGGAADRGEFWNRLEQHHKRGDACVAREIEVSLPAELTADERQALALSYAQGLADRYSVAADIAIHEPSKKGDDRNHHAHILLSACLVNPDGTLGKKCVELDPIAALRAKPARPTPVLAERERWAEAVNQALATAGHASRVDHRTLAEQAKAAEMKGDLTAAALLAREPTQHEGKTNTAAKRAGHVLDRARQNDTIRQANRDALAGYVRQVRAEGRLVPTPTGQQTTAQRDVSTVIKPVGVRTHERTLKTGTTTMVRGHTRLAHVTAPAGKASLGSAATTGAQKTAAKETERQLNAWIAQLAADGRKISQQTEETLKALARAPSGSPIAQGHSENGAGFRLWLLDYDKTLKEHEHAKTRPERRVEAYETAMTETVERARKLHKWEAANPQPAPRWWNPNDKRQWAERRRRHSDPFERQQAREAKAQTLATDPDHLRAYERQAEAVMERLRKQEAERAATWPMAGLDFEIEFGPDVPGLVSMRDLNDEPKLGEAADPAKRAKTGAQVRPRPRPPNL
jgi:hypothetical protein